MLGSLSDIAVRDEVNEGLADAALTRMGTLATKIRKRIHWNRDPLQSGSKGCPGCFGAKNGAHPPGGYPRYIVHRSRKVNIGQAP